MKVITLLSILVVLGNSVHQITNLPTTQTLRQKIINKAIGPELSEFRAALQLLPDMKHTVERVNSVVTDIQHLLSRLPSVTSSFPFKSGLFK